MPELPEVETVKLGLEKLIVGKKIKAVRFDWPKSFPNVPSDIEKCMVGATIQVVRRRAKVLIIELSSSYVLLIHLKMTGQLVFVDDSEKTTQKSDSVQSDISHSQAEESSVRRFGAGHPNDSLIGALPDKSTRVIIEFTDHSNLFFNDQRKFGWMKLVSMHELQSIPMMQKFGPEPLEPTFTADVFIDRLRRRNNTTIKAALLDQAVLAGVGNIYADESLWGAKIHPSTRVKTISRSRLKVLHKELQFVLLMAIEKGGSTDRNYVNAEGKKGSYITFARVFRRENLPCPRCGTVIEKIRVAGRGTHVCPKCQPISTQ